MDKVKYNLDVKITLTEASSKTGTQFRIRSDSGQTETSSLNSQSSIIEIRDMFNKSLEAILRYKFVYLGEDTSNITIVEEEK